MNAKDDQTSSSQPNDASVEEIRDWWSKHPMNYQGYVQPELKSDEDYRKFFDIVNDSWRKATNQTNSAEHKYLCDRIIDRERIAGKRVLVIGCGNNANKPGRSTGKARY